MIQSKYLKLIGYIFIGIGALFFSEYFKIMSELLFVNDMSMVNLLKSASHILFDLGGYHIIGSTLIGVGIFCLWKSKRLKIED